MELNLHAGGELIDYNMLAQLDTPAPTATHLPIPHKDVVDMAKYALQFYGHEVTDEAHAIDHEGQRYFGLLTLRSPDGHYSDTVGLRNSHDRTFPIGIAIGAKVFVCSNLSFFGEHVIKRRHTPRAKRDLPGLIAEIVEPLHEKRKAQQITFDRYRAAELTPELADHAILTMYREGVLNVTRLAPVVQQYQEPEFDWGDRPTAWRLFNAATYALSGRVAENPQGTARLHAIIDGVCERLN